MWAHVACGHMSRANALTMTRIQVYVCYDTGVCAYCYDLTMTRIRKPMAIAKVSVHCMASSLL